MMIDHRPFEMRIPANGEYHSQEYVMAKPSCEQAILQQRTGPSAKKSGNSKAISTLSCTTFAQTWCPVIFIIFYLLTARRRQEPRLNSRAYSAYKLSARAAYTMC